MKLHQRIITAVFFILLFTPNAYSGIPFISDDPATVPYGQWESYLYSAVDRTSSYTLVQIPANETDIGVGTNLELHFVLPYAFYLPQQRTKNARTAGFDDMELGIKYRMVNESRYRPSLAFAPMFEMPTGDASRKLGNGRFWMMLPLWLEKNWGPWTSYGGGGYTFNPAPTMRSYPFSGWVVQRYLTQKLILGSELFWQGPASATTKAFTIFDVGGYYYFKRHFGLIFSAGQTIIGERHVVGSLGLFWTG